MNQRTGSLGAKDQQEITMLLNRFAWIADEGDVEEFGVFFHPDVVWDMGEVRWEGRDAVVSGLGSMRAAGHAGPESGVRHLMLNLEIDDSGTLPRARSIFCLCTGGVSPMVRMLGTYSDIIERITEGWVIRERVIRTL